MFEERISELQKKMLALGLEYSTNSASKIYIYGSHENNLFDFDAFFEVEGEILKKHKVPLGLTQSQMIERQRMFVDIGLSDFIEFCEIFSSYDKPVPTQLKLTYDLVGRKAGAEYSYDLFYSNSDTLTSDDIFLQWYEEVKEKVERSK